MLVQHPHALPGFLAAVFPTGSMLHCPVLSPFMNGSSPPLLYIVLSLCVYFYPSYIFIPLHTFSLVTTLLIVTDVAGALGLGLADLAAGSSFLVAVKTGAGSIRGTSSHRGSLPIS